MKKTLFALGISLFSLGLCQILQRVEASVGQTVEAFEEEAPTPRQLRSGRKTFQLHCQSCHGSEGRHPDETFNLADDVWSNGDSFEDIKATIEEGVPGTQMLGFEGRLSDEKITAVAHYVMTLSKESSE